MDRWPHEVKSTTFEQIAVAIKDPEWQKFRNALKGISTQSKLILLDTRIKKFKVDGKWSTNHRVQVDNYINALKRGGQLNVNFEVVK